MRAFIILFFLSHFTVPESKSRVVVSQSTAMGGTQSSRALNGDVVGKKCDIRNKEGFTCMSAQKKA